MARNSSVRRLTQAGAAGDALDDVWSQALRRGEVCHGHACKGRTAMSPCPRGCPQGTGRLVKLPWGTQAGPWQRHRSPARARRPPGARSGTWLGRPRRPRCKQRWACRAAEECSPPAPLSAVGVLTAGPGSWRGRRRSGAAPGSGPGSSSAPPRPADRGRALSLGTRPAPHPQGPHPGWGLWGSLPGTPRVCPVPTAPRDPPLEKHHPAERGWVPRDTQGHPGARGWEDFELPGTIPGLLWDL